MYMGMNSNTSKTHLDISIQKKCPLSPKSFNQYPDIQYPISPKSLNQHPNTHYP